jgi:hypothetical protein
MKDLPAFLTIPAVLIWIATRDFEACQKAFEAVETLHRHPFAAEDDKVAVWVPVRHFGLTAVSVLIAQYLHPDDRTIRDKWWTFEVLDNGSVRVKGKKRDTAAIDYEYAPAQRELLRALREKNITADTHHPDNSLTEINAALWWRLEFEDEEGKDGHYHVIATATGKEPLRDIVFEKDDVLRKWPPNGGEEPDSKMAEVVRQISPLKATTKVQGYKFKKQYQWESAEEYLDKWKPKPGVKDPFFGLRERTIEYVAQKCGCSKGAVKQSVGKLISERTEKMRKAFRQGTCPDFG